LLVIVQFSAGHKQLNFAVGIVFGSRFDRAALASVQVAVSGRIVHVNSLTVDRS
jgi:hypothetical protein